MSKICKSSNDNCHHCGIYHNAVFGYLSVQYHSHFEEKVKRLTIDKNELLFREGQYMRGVYFVNQGKLKVFSSGDSGKEQIIKISKENSAHGFRALLSNKPSKVSAEALEELQLCFISKEDFLSLLDELPFLKEKVLAAITEELSEMVTAVTNMAQQSVNQRLANALLALYDIYKTADNDQNVEINLAREDLANIVGTATAHLIRSLQKLKEANIIDIQGRKINIIDYNKLYSQTIE